MTPVRNPPDPSRHDARLQCTLDMGVTATPPTTTLDLNADLASLGYAPLSCRTALLRWACHLAAVRGLENVHYTFG
jgi:hypothetical protein